MPSLTLQAILLGFIQGLTEFLPISSSGHLVIGQRFLGLDQPELLFDVVVHLGTLAAVAVVFFRDLKALTLELPTLFKALAAPGRFGPLYRQRPYFRLGLLILLGTVPTALIGFVFKDPLTALFSSTLAVGLALLVTGALLFATRFIPAGTRRTGPGSALAIGFIQGLAIIPGVSRSGSTISLGLFMGLDRQEAARFSFLLSLPAIVGALILESAEAGACGFSGLALGLGFLAAFFSGWLALKVLLKVVKNGRLHNFSYYCWALGLAVIILTLTGSW